MEMYVSVLCARAWLVFHIGVFCDACVWCVCSVCFDVCCCGVMLWRVCCVCPFVLLLLCCGVLLLWL